MINAFADLFLYGRLPHVWHICTETHKTVECVLDACDVYFIVKILKSPVLFKKCYQN